MAEKTERSLVKKLAEVTAAIGRVPKSGFNKFHNYHYAMEADVVEAVRGEYAKRNLVMFPCVLSERTEMRATKNGGQENLVTLLVGFTVIDGDSGEEQTFHVCGQGQDAGDKGTYKAMTGATKYALMKLHLLATGDDPEAEDAPHEQEVRATKPETEQTKPAGGHNRSLSFKFGRDAGTPLEKLPEASLKWYRDCLQKSLNDPSKSTFKGQNMLEMAAVDAELRLRAS
jgi:hypothetical protein